MKNLIVLMLAIFIFVGCKKEAITTPLIEEITTAKAPVKICNPVCDITKTPDITLVTNLEEPHELRPDGTAIDSFTYFWLKYQTRTRPVVFEQDHIVTTYEASYYPGWVAGDVISKVRLQCLIENVAPKDCKNDWVFNESQGELIGNSFLFEGLFEFETFEKGNGNNWRPVYVDYKKQFYPSYIPAYPYWYSTDFCYYFGNGERSIQAGMGDFYSNWFRLPNHDGVFKIIIKFNPASKNGCRVVNESNYDNNNKVVYMRVSNGVLTYSLSSNI